MRYLTIALALLLALPACSGPKQSAAARPETIRRLLPEEFAEMTRDTNTLVVNVQPTPAGDIPGTRFNLSGERAFESLRVVQPDMTRPIALYCEQGKLSDTLAAQLARAGYSSVCVLRGGYRAWIDQGLPFRLRDNQE